MSCKLTCVRRARESSTPYRIRAAPRPRAGAREVPMEVPQLVITNPVLPPRGEAYIVQLTPSMYRGDNLEGVSVNLQLELESVVEHMRG